jgi:serine/threonine-protein kinase
MSEPNFFAELKRRNVYKVAVAYAVVAWLVIQAASILFPTFEMPPVAMKLLVFVLAGGFIIALIVAWAFEMTPEGMKRTTEVSSDELRTLPYWSKRKFVAVIVTLALIAAALLAFQLIRGRSNPRLEGGAQATPNKDGLAGARPSISSQSIAVLPLLNESGDPKDEYFSDGLSEELIAALAQISELKVIGRSSSFRFKERKEDSKTIGEKLGVTTLLEGTVRKQGDRVRIVAELVNASDGIELWTRTFDRELKDIFAVQQEIAAAVASSLKTTLLGPDQRPAQTSRTPNAEAHNAYLLGHHHFQRRNIDDYRKAVGYFDEAIRLDPEYALAYAERSETWTLIGDLVGESKTAWPKARSDAEKAVAVGPGLAEAHAALGWVRFFTEWKFAEGLAELKRAKELSSASPIANDLLARALVYVGDPDDAERQVRQSVEVDPLAAFPLNNLARILWYRGKVDEAEAAARKSAELQPSSASSRRWQVLVAVRRGDGEGALREAQLEPDESYRRFELAIAHQARGDRQAADAALADLMANNRGLDYQVAQVYAFRGDQDKAFEWLQVSFDNHDTGMLALRVDPLLDTLRDDARFKALVAKMNFPAMP